MYCFLTLLSSRLNLSSLPLSTDYLSLPHISTLIHYSNTFLYAPLITHLFLNSHHTSPASLPYILSSLPALHFSPITSFFLLLLFYTYIISTPLSSSNHLSSRTPLPQMSVWQPWRSASKWMWRGMPGWRRSRTRSRTPRPSRNRRWKQRRRSWRSARRWQQRLEANGTLWNKWGFFSAMLSCIYSSIVSFDLFWTLCNRHWFVAVSSSPPLSPSHFAINPVFPFIFLSFTLLFYTLWYFPLFYTLLLPLMYVISPSFRMHSLSFLLFYSIFTHFFHLDMPSSNFSFSALCPFADIFLAPVSFYAMIIFSFTHLFLSLLLSFPVPQKALVN